MVDDSGCSFREADGSAATAGARIYMRKPQEKHITCDRPPMIRNVPLGCFF